MIPSLLKNFNPEVNPFLLLFILLFTIKWIRSKDPVLQLAAAILILVAMFHIGLI